MAASPSPSLQPLMGGGSKDGGGFLCPQLGDTLSWQVHVGPGVRQGYYPERGEGHVCVFHLAAWAVPDAPFLQACGAPGPRTPPWLTHPPAGKDQGSLPPGGGTCWTSPRGSEPRCVTRGRGRNLPPTRGPTQPAGRLWDAGEAHLAWGTGEPQTLQQKDTGDTGHWPPRLLREGFEEHFPCTLHNAP